MQRAFSNRSALPHTDSNVLARVKPAVRCLCAGSLTRGCWNCGSRQHQEDKHRADGRMPPRRSHIPDPRLDAITQVSALKMRLAAWAAIHVLVVPE